MTLLKSANSAITAIIGTNDLEFLRLELRNVLAKSLIVRSIICLLVSFITLTALAQDFESLLEKAESLKDQDPIECERIIQNILDADSLRVPLNVRIEALKMLGIIKMYNYQFDASNVLFKRAFSLSKYLSTSDNQIKGSLLIDIGRNYNWQSKYDSALSSFLKAKEIYEAANYKKGIAEALNSIAVITIQYSNDPNKALEYFQSALKIHNEMEDDESAARVMQNIGQIYNMIGDNDSALYFIRKSNTVVKNLNDFRSLAIGSNILGAIFYDLNELDSSEFYYKRAIQLDLQNQDSVGLIYDYSQLSNTLLAQKKFTEAKKYGRLAFDNTKDIYLKSESAEILSRISEEQKDFQTALYYYKEFKQHSDSIRREDQQTTIDELQTKYETAEKEKEIQLANIELEKKQRFQTFLITVIGVIVLFSLITIFLIIQRFKLRRALLSQEIDTLRAQINSVFEGSIKGLNIDLDQINDGLFKPLSEREFEVLNEAVSDKTNSEIADSLFLSVNTVKFHLKNIYEKLGVTNRKEALNKILSKA